MASSDATTSLQRTYAYLRIALVITIVVIFVSVAVAVPVVGWLPSLSQYFYTPARTGFTGALIAASLALFALSGRGAEPVILDAAALLAPLIAIVPSVIDVESAPGVADGCPGACVPEAYVVGVDNGVSTYLVVGAIVVVVAVTLTGFRHIVPGVWVALAVLAVVAVSWRFFLDAFLLWGHAVAATAFFALIALFALRSAFPRDTEAFPPGPGLRRAYVAIAVLLVADVVALGVVALTAGGEGYGVLVGEAFALVLFATFWVLQTVQKWGQTDPSLVA